MWDEEKEESKCGKRMRKRESMVGEGGRGTATEWQEEKEVIKCGKRMRKRVRVAG